MEKENISVHTLEPLQPDPAVKRLDVLVGKCNLRGRTLDTAEDHITGWVNFEWLPGGFFLQANGENVYSNMDGKVTPFYWDIQGNTVTHWTEGSK